MYLTDTASISSNDNASDGVVEMTDSDTGAVFNIYADDETILLDMISNALTI